MNNTDPKHLSNADFVPLTWKCLYALLSESTSNELKEEYPDKGSFIAQDSSDPVIEPIWDSVLNRMEDVPRELFRCQNSGNPVGNLRNAAKKLLLSLSRDESFNNFTHDDRVDLVKAECQKVIDICDWADDCQDPECGFPEDGFVNLDDLYRIVTEGQDPVLSVDLRPQKKFKNAVLNGERAHYEVFREAVSRPWGDLFISDGAIDGSKLDGDRTVKSYDDDGIFYLVRIHPGEWSIMPKMNHAMSFYAFVLCLAQLETCFCDYRYGKDSDWAAREAEGWYDNFVNGIDWDNLDRNGPFEWVDCYRQKNLDPSVWRWYTRPAPSDLQDRTFVSPVAKRLLGRDSFLEINGNRFISDALEGGLFRQHYKMLVGSVLDAKGDVIAEIGKLKSMLADILVDIRCLCSQTRRLAALFVPKDEARKTLEEARQGREKLTEARRKIEAYFETGEEQGGMFSQLTIWIRNGKQFLLPEKPLLCQEEIARLHEQMLDYEIAIKQHIRETIEDENFLTKPSSDLVVDDPFIEHKGKRRKLPLNELVTKGLIKVVDEKYIIPTDANRSDLARMLAVKDFIEFDFRGYMDRVYKERKNKDFEPARRKTRWDICKGLFYQEGHLDEAIDPRIIKKSFTECLDSLGIIKEKWQKEWKAWYESQQATAGLRQ